MSEIRIKKISTGQKEYEIDAAYVKLQAKYDNKIFPLVCSSDGALTTSGSYFPLYNMATEANGGIVFNPSDMKLIIGDFSETDGGDKLVLGKSTIQANNLDGGFNIDTNSADWSLGTPSYGSDMCNISGSNGTMSLRSKDISINSVGGNINIGTNYSSGLITSSPHIYTVAMSKNEIIGDYNLTIMGGFNIAAENNGVNITGNCYASTFYETSDENLKNFSDDITVDFNKLKEIRKSYFTWKDGDQNLHIGTSAQDIQKVYPELVSEDNKGNLTVDYAKLSIIALSAIDKLDERLSRIENILNKEE